MKKPATHANGGAARLGRDVDVALGRGGAVGVVARGGWGERTSDGEEQREGKGEVDVEDVLLFRLDDGLCARLARQRDGAGARQPPPRAPEGGGGRRG